MHAYHDGLPGFDSEHILHDGCDECEDRGRRLKFGALDGGNFERMWERAFQWNCEGNLRPSNAEIPMLDVLWRIICQLERRGIDCTTCPGTSYAEQKQAFRRLERKT